MPDPYAAGGIAGKIIFDAAGAALENDCCLKSIQSAALLILTAAALIYNIRKSEIRTHNIKGIFPCTVIGLLLGLLSSFLGIGGGPVNIVVLHYFYSMDSKKAAQNSLFIIFLSQIANLAYTALTFNIPQVPGLLLLLMSCGAVAGAALGQAFNKKLSNRTVDKMFSALMVLIIFICIYNSVSCGRSFTGEVI